MFRHGIVVVVALVVGAWLAAAQPDGPAESTSDARFATGEALFVANCALCHQASGQGSPGMFPALAGNEALQDLALIVTNIHEGKGAMPAFPHLGPEEVAALATYIRNAWGNDFGPVAAEDVAARLAGAGEIVLRSVWDSVYTLTQAQRGDRLYASNCSQCHGYVWLGSAALRERVAEARTPTLLHVSDPLTGPPLDDDAFLGRWDGLPLGALFQFTRSSMPIDNPGLLSDQEYVDIIAFLLAAGGLPAGDDELVPDVEVLDRILIDAEPAD